MGTFNRLVRLAIPLFALTSCSLQGINFQARRDSSAHNAHSDCKSCHTVAKPEGETARFPSYTDPSDLCRACHNYEANHHPVNLVPTIAIKSRFPLFSGKIKCLTCHEMHGGPQHRGTPRLLRGGPYTDLRTICFNCHTVEQYAHINPHIMTEDGENRTSVNGKVVCLYCHELEPEPSQDRANMVLFKADVSFLCLRCHTLMHTDYFEKHFQVTPSEEISKNISSPERQVRFSLPLVPRGRITCTTCHNPHQEGIITYGPSAAGADSVHRLRDGNVCIGCH